MLTLAGFLTSTASGFLELPLFNHHSLGLITYRKMAATSDNGIPAWVKPFDLNGKVAIVTGAGSGINLAVTKHLLQAGTSVVLADVRLRPEAEELVAQHPHEKAAAAAAASSESKSSSSSSKGSSGKPSAIFLKTDVVDWAQLRTLFDGAVAHFGKVDMIVNGAGIFEPPQSNFWVNPDHSELAGDSADCNPGVYKTFAVNTMAPIRLAQIAVDYWSRTFSPLSLHPFLNCPCK